MRYTPKHAAQRSSAITRPRAAGVVLASAATVGAGLVGTGSSASAATPHNVWDRVAQCESGGNWAISTGNGYYGGLQFNSRAWTGFGGRQFAATANRATRDQQIIVAQRILARMGPGAWPVCSRRAGLTKANGLAVKVGSGGGSSSGGGASRGDARHLAVDGVLGPNTARGIQKWVGAPRTGVFDTTTRKALQRKVGVHPDGVIGANTMRALQTKLNTRRDGARSMNPRTINAMQRYLNKYVL